VPRPPSTPRGAEPAAKPRLLISAGPPCDAPLVEAVRLARDGSRKLQLAVPLWRGWASVRGGEAAAPRPAPYRRMR
jgi:hypothetical protein